jgi:hemerythrin-like metal-binding protein
MLLEQRGSGTVLSGQSLTMTNRNQTINSMPQWRPSLEVGIPAIDEAHKTIILRLGQLHELLFSPENALGSQATSMRRIQVSTQARLMLSLLENYSREHFAQEEALMHCRDCPFRAVHAKAHQHLHELLEGWTSSLREDVRQENNERMREVIVTFAHWFERHVRTVDSRLKAAKA